MSLIQEPLPSEYLGLSQDEMDRRIRQNKSRLGSKLVILGHHYQRDDVICYADYRGDSLKLSQLAARERQAEYIVFCGVHFMAETADVLTSPQQKVILPDLMAGCSMADMAELAQVEECWDSLEAEYGKEIIPVTYVNSTADIKAFCGRHRGMTCTSSNAGRIFARLLQEDRIILFLPDEHLGRNTGLEYGVKPEEMLLWDPEAQDRELPVQPPRLVLWNGFCSVHQKFTPDQIDQIRKKNAGIKVLVHPECSSAVVSKADLAGSTEFIIRTVSESPAGSSWAVGTELNLVNRLAKENPDKQVLCLNETMCLCVTMNRIDRPHLLWALDNLAAGRVGNQIKIDPATAGEARLALDRMLEISS